MSQTTGSDEPKVIFASDGSPFKTPAAAQAYITRKGLDPTHYVAQQRDDGWIIIEIKGEVQIVRTQEAAEAAMAKASGSVGGNKKADTYFKVRFHPKSNKNDDDDVHLGVNGETLQIQRNVMVIVPKRFLEAADHGIYQHFIVEPGKDRKVAYEVITYPYDQHGEASEAEYREFLKTRKCA